MRQWESVTVNREDSDLIQKMAEMAELHYGAKDDIAHAEYLAHEYFHDPAGDALIEIAWDREKNRAAGQYIAIPIRVRIRGVDSSCLMSVNTLTREEYRGQGIFTGLAAAVYERAAAKGYRLAYGMPNQHSYPGFVKALSFEDRGAVPLYLRPLRPSNLVRSYLKWNWAAALASPFDPVFRMKEPGAVSVEKLTPENLELADAFWKSVRDEYPVMICRDSTYIRYRYLDIPRRKYQCFYAVEEGRPVAFAGGRVMEVANLQCGMTADFLFLSGHEDAAWAVLRKLMFSLQQEGADMIGCMTPPGSKETRLLRRHGFFKCPKAMEPQPFRFILRILQSDDQAEDIKELKNWFFTMGDYDVV